MNLLKNPELETDQGEGDEKSAVKVFELEQVQADAQRLKELREPVMNAKPRPAAAVSENLDASNKD